MERIIKKTKKERDIEHGKLPVKKIKVKDINYFYFVCDVCDIAYFGDDLILKMGDSGGFGCPNKRGLFKKVCKHSVYGGDEKCFNKYYKLKP